MLVCRSPRALPRMIAGWPDPHHGRKSPEFHREARHNVLNLGMRGVSVPVAQAAKSSEYVERALVDHGNIVKQASARH
jgi:hypothetical protein